MKEKTLNHGILFRLLSWYEINKDTIATHFQGILHKNNLNVQNANKKQCKILKNWFQAKNPASSYA